MSTLEIKNLHVQVATGDGPKPILKGVDLAVGSGEVHAIMGPNGSGKSTLAYSIAGHPDYEVTDGEVLLDGIDLLEMSVDERARALGVLLVAPAQAADGLAGAALNARVGDDEVRVGDALADGPHPTALESDRGGRAGRRRVQSGRVPVRDPLGHLREREQLIGGGVASAGVQNGADDRARRRGGGAQPARVGEVAAGGDLEGLAEAPRELPGLVECAGDAGEPGPAAIDGAAVVEAAQPRRAGHRHGRRPHPQIVQRQGHGGVPVHDGVLAQEDDLRPGPTAPLADGGVPVHLLPLPVDQECGRSCGKSRPRPG